MMALEFQKLAISHGLQFPVQDLLGHRDAIVLENPLCEINQPPVHHPVGGWIGAVLDPLGKGAPVLVLEQGRWPGALPSLRPSGPLVEKILVAALALLAAYWV